LNQQPKAVYHSAGPGPAWCPAGDETGAAADAVTKNMAIRTVTRGSMTYKQPPTPTPIRRDHDDETAAAGGAVCRPPHCQVAITPASAKLMAIYALMTGRF
jgi:hypothetical protein